MVAVHAVRRQRHAPVTQEHVPDTYLHVSPPLVVRTAWSEQLQRWVWMEYLDELEDVADAPNQGVVAVHGERMTDQPVGRLMQLREASRSYRVATAEGTPHEYEQVSPGQWNRLQESQVGMNTAEIEEVRTLLGDDAERPEFGNAVPGSRRWRAVARGFLRERFPFTERRQQRKDDPEKT